MKKFKIPVFLLFSQLLSGCSNSEENSELAAKAYYNHQYEISYQLASSENLSGDIRSQRLLATLYFEGKGTSRAPKKSIAILTPLADAGDAKSQTLLAAIYTAPGAEKNVDKAIFYNLEAIAQGNAQASLNLGQIYLYGLSKNKDKQLAKHYLLLATRLGSAEAPLLLGTILPSQRQRCEQLSLSAERGSIQGARMHARCLVQNAKTDKDFTDARYWYGVAARQGDHHAQANLGYLAETGLGSVADTAEAGRWYCQAKNTIPSAAIRLKILKFSCADLQENGS